MVGLNHYGLCDQNNPPGADADDKVPTVPQPQAVALVSQWTGLFLRATVQGDKSASDYVFVSGDALEPKVLVESMP